jgi:hypothetical protein
MNKTRKANRGRGKGKGKGRGVATRGWKKEQPGTHQRTVMLQKCGKKCFLGPNKSFPICKKNTCKVSSKGVYAAYIRAREYRTRGQKYRTISKKANRMLIKMGAKR